ncbi:Imm26 family immunity protein [Candidatus Pantoea multigeneris]|uniref:Immunity protein 26 n=1 Tax=Candidatus Pantoea multigeneris TaxID=2608357 RepID=A0ABX0R9Q2_9GAMM|nr:Imm26 family immunity protein [Pantoea multigeneris]NIF22095.1 hypothetical protein [Pantoea multigeneris]
MADKVTVMPGNGTEKKWPNEGDVFYFKLSDGRFGYGMVSLGKIDVGPFKNAIVIYIYDSFTLSPDENITLKKEDLLLPPIITNASCWKNGYFVTLKKLGSNRLDVYHEHYFKNPIRNKVYNHNGIETELPIDNIPVGEESIQFHKSVINSIEYALN